jgi:hypothetical protein
MTDITAGQENDVSVGTDVNATSLNVQGTVSYVLSVRTQIPTIDGIEAHGGPGGQNLRTPGFGTNNGGAGVLGYGGDAGEFEDLHELLPPGPGVVGLGGSSPTDAANGAPGVIGVGSGGPHTNPSGPAGVYGQGGPGSPGVVGQAGSAPADGVQGYGTGGFSGVAGYGDPADNGTGVFGMGRGPGAQGVRGIGSGGLNVFPSSPVGVYGQGGAFGAAGVLGAGGIGVMAEGSNVGVVAEGGPTGLNAIGATVGVRSQGHTGVVATTDGKPGSTALFASANPANETAGLFLGEVAILGDLRVSGLKAAVVPLADGTYRRLYCVETPDSWFEDVGFGTLVNGHAAIRLDPDFAATVQTDHYHVFITEYDGNNALYVTARSATGFEVRAGAGAVDASFSFRVMAKRKDIQGARLQEAQLPTPPPIGQPPSGAPLAD